MLNESREVAKHLMLSIQIANGLVDKNCESLYPEKWVKKIDEAVIRLIENSEIEFTDQIIAEMATWDFERRTQKFGHLKGWTNLDVVLNDYYMSLWFWI